MGNDEITRMENQRDITLGVIGTAGSFGLGTINDALGILAALATIIYMGFCIRREWRNRRK
jgi:hypothetical protein